MRKFSFVALFLISVGSATTVQAHAMLTGMWLFATATSSFVVR
jgi:hypothetical protein